MAHAVDNIVVGAEACYFFQKGLKESVSSLLLNISSSGALEEFTDVSQLAARAKALEAHMRKRKRQTPAAADEGEFLDVKGKAKAGRRSQGTKRPAAKQPESSRQGAGQR